MSKNELIIDEATFSRIWKIAEEIGIQERHFNGLQAGYRNMASAWLLATFAGIGCSISQSLHISIDRELLIGGIAVFGSIGIALLWVMDLLVYHRLLDSCFIEGLRLEEQNPWLPPFRRNMMNSQNGQGVLFRTVGFYMAPIMLLIVIAGSAFSFWFYRNQAPIIAAALIVVDVLIAVLVGHVIRSKTENTAPIRHKLS